MTAPTPQPDAERVQGEVAAAVRRTEGAIYEAVWGGPRDEDRAPDAEEYQDARTVLAAALDVEEMAEVLDLHGGEAFLVTGGGQITECPTCGEVPTDLASHLATALRASLLGSDQ